MTLPASGAISFNAINVELGQAGTTSANINQASYRTLAGVPSGQIALSNFYGKSNRVSISYTFSANTNNASLNVSSISGYVAGKSDITITVNSGIYLWSSSTGTHGLTLSGGTTGDTILLVNNGYIMGQGGLGGGGSVNGPGGPALSLGYHTTINNTNASAYIGGGGGGGLNMQNVGGFGGGGGGAGGGAGAAPSSGGISGGAGGAIGSAGAVGGTGNTVSQAQGGGAGGGGGGSFVSTSGKTTSTFYGGGAGGGRIFPGSGGAGGSGGGGNGGAGNAAGTTGTRVGGSVGSGSGGGGGWGASGGSGWVGGKAVSLNGFTVTWVSGNTTRVYGSVS